MSSSGSGSDRSEGAAGEIPKKHVRSESAVRKGLQIGLGLTAMVAGAILLWYAAQVLLVFFAAIFLAVFFSGLGRFLQKNTRFT